LPKKNVDENRFVKLQFYDNYAQYNQKYTVLCTTSHLEAMAE